MLQLEHSMVEWNSRRNMPAVRSAPSGRSRRVAGQ
jgi:hypothetical protein